MLTPQRRKRNVLKRFLLTLLSVVAASCGLQDVAFAQSKPVYVTHPTLQQVSDSSITPVLVFFDERTMFWSNMQLLTDRDLLQESGACLHIARQMGPDGFKVDSIAPAVDWRKSSWKGTPQVNCADTVQWAPLHYHMVTLDMFAWLTTSGYDATYIIQHRCEPSDADKDITSKRHYPFEALQCGLGPDSVLAYRIAKPNAKTTAAR